MPVTYELVNRVRPDNVRKFRFAIKKKSRHDMMQSSKTDTNALEVKIELILDISIQNLETNNAILG